MTDNVVSNPGAGGATWRTFGDSAGKQHPVSIPHWITGGDAVGGWTVQNLDTTHGMPVAQQGTWNVTVTQGTAANLKVDLSGTGANATALKVDGSAATQPVSGTVSITGTVTCDTELPTAALLADSTSNPTIPSIGSFIQVYNPSLNAWDRVRSIVNALDSSGTGMLATGLAAQVDETSPSVVTENQWGAVRMSPQRALLVQGLDRSASGVVTAVSNNVTINSQGAANIGIIVFSNNNVTLLFEGAVDGISFVTLNAYPAGGGASVTGTTGNGSWVIPCSGFAQVRARVTAVGASPSAQLQLGASIGTGSAVTVVSPTAANLNANVSGTITANQGGAPWTSNITQLAGVAIDTNSGNKSSGTLRVVLATDQPGLTNGLSVAEKPTTSGGLSMFHLVSASGTNSTVVKASAGQIYSVQLFNASSSAAFVKIVDRATAPTPGIHIPVKSLLVPPNNSGLVLNWSAGLAFSNGITFFTVSAMNDGSSSPVGLNDLLIEIDYA